MAKNNTARATAQTGQLPIHIPEWHGLEPHARVLMSVAVAHGIEVTYNRAAEAWIWTGTKEQWLAADLFPANSRWNFKRQSHFWTPRGVYGTMRWAGDGRAQFEIMGFPCGQKTKRLTKASVDSAAGWGDFKAKMLQPVEATEAEDREARICAACDQWWDAMNKEERAYVYGLARNHVSNFIRMNGGA